MSVEVTLALCLPRDASTIPFVRHLAKFALTEMGVTRASVADVEIALTEACANVVQHATADDEYEITLAIGDTECSIRVVDTGHGFDADSLGHDDAHPTAEQGRGIQLMRALVDRIAFTSEPEKGTVVHLVKVLEFGDRPPFLRAET